MLEAVGERDVAASALGDDSAGTGDVLVIGVTTPEYATISEASDD